MKLFSYDGLLMRLFNRLFDLMLLSLVWWVCCIPVFTVGAATTALYDTVITLQKTDPPLIRYYFMSFKKHFKTATICWIVLFVLLIIIGVDYYAFFTFWPEYLNIVRIVTIILLTVVGFTMMMVFPNISVFEGTKNPMEQLLNAVIMAFVHVPSTIAMVAIYSIITWIALQMFVLLGLMMLLGPGIGAFLNANILSRLYKEYINEAK